MFARRFWQQGIESAWDRRSVVWLYGVRRAGKTILCRTLPETEFFDCELPSVRKQLQDPESFLRSLGKRRIVLDEIHRLPDPSELLKIASDHFPHVRIVATGSSTLGASSRFRDTLTGRKTDVWLTPMIRQDLADFGNEDLKSRLHKGGLPPHFLESLPRESLCQEWMDAYWAKDIQELFRLERRVGFQRLLELIFVRSGGIFEATSYAAPCEISRPTVANYLGALEATMVVQVVRPFSARGSGEIISAPKVYAFDTGFVCAFRGWRELHDEDLGLLWEHFVLNEIHAHRQLRDVRYWRDKRGHEVDFVLAGRGRAPIAIECKWSSNSVDLAGLKSFRLRYPEGPNWIVAQDIARPFRRRDRGLEVEYIGLEELARRIR